MSTNLITRAGIESLKAELEVLKFTERPKVIADIAEARSHGDLKENSEYAAAKEKQSHVEGRINELEQLIASLNVFDPESASNLKEVRFGAMCILINVKDKKEKKIQIVSPFEADFKRGLIAIDAPVAKALLGKTEGEEVEINSVKFKLESVTY